MATRSLTGHAFVETTTIAKCPTDDPDFVARREPCPTDKLNKSVGVLATL